MPWSRAPRKTIDALAFPWLSAFSRYSHASWSLPVVISRLGHRLGRLFLHALNPLDSDHAVTPGRQGEAPLRRFLRVAALETEQKPAVVVLRVLLDREDGTRRLGEGAGTEDAVERLGFASLVEMAHAEDRQLFLFRQSHQRGERVAHRGLVVQIGVAGDKIGKGIEDYEPRPRVADEFRDVRDSFGQALEQWAVRIGAREVGFHDRHAVQVALAALRRGTSAARMLSSMP